MPLTIATTSIWRMATLLSPVDFRPLLSRYLIKGTSIEQTRALNMLLARFAGLC